MGLHSAGFAIVLPGSSGVVLEIIGSTDVQTYIREIGVSISSLVAGSTQIQLAQVGTQGITPGGLVALQGEDVNDVAGASLATSWGTPPALTGSALRREIIPASVGSGFLWRFDPGLLLAVSGASNSLALRSANASTNTINVHVVLEEE